MAMKHLLVAAVCAALTSAANAAFLFEIDTDGADDDVLTLNPNFSFGGDTTTASQSSASSAFGTNGADSIFGGDGNVDPDTYVYTYDPSVEGDNLVVPAGTDLGDGVLASGLAAGGAGVYNVFATWPLSSNINPAGANFDVSTAGDAFTVSDLDQNGQGNAWILLGQINYTSGPITVTQTANVNSFVSMRAYGLLFEPIPEPTTLSLLGLAGLLIRRR